MARSTTSLPAWAGSPRVVLPLLLLLAFVLRFAWPLADPAESLSWSGGIYTDPPANVLAARYAIEPEGPRPAPDPGMVGVVYPLLNGLAWVGFRTFGVDRLAMQVLAALLGAFAVVPIWLGIRRGAGGPAALLAAALLAVAWWLAMYSRILMAENLVVAMLAVASWFAFGRCRRDLSLAVAVGFAAVLFGKYLAAGAVAGLLVFLARRNGPGRMIVPALLGGGVVTALWIAVIFLPNRAELLAWIGRSWGEATGGAGGLPSAGGWLLEPFRALRDSWMFPSMPLLSSVGLVWIARTLTSGDLLRERVESGTAGFAFWFVGMFALDSLMPYRAPRYFVLVAFPVVVGAAIQLAELLDPAKRPKRSDFSRSDRLAWVLAAPFVVFGLLEAAKHLERAVRDRFLLEETIRAGGSPELFSPVYRMIASLPAHVSWSVGIAAVALAIRWRAPRGFGFGRGAGGGWSAAKRRRLALVLTASIVTLELGRWIAWAGSRTSVIEGAKESLAAVVSPDAVVLGGFAPLLTLGTEIRAAPQFGSWEDVDFDGPAGVTHVLLDPGGMETLEAIRPEIRARLEPVQVWPMRQAWVRRLELLRLDTASEPPRDYRRTPFERAVDALRANDPATALALAAEARAAGGPPLPDWLILEATCRYRSGERPAAERLLRQALELRPNDPTLYLNVGILALEAGNRSRALETWRRGLAIDPGNGELAEMLRQHGS